MSGIVVPAPMRRTLLLRRSTAEELVTCAADITDQISPSGASPSARSSIIPIVISARRSIASSALALAGRAEASVLQLLRSL